MKSPVDLARSLGLHFVAVPCGDLLLFDFKVPDIESPDFFDTTSRIADWSKRVAPWTLDTLNKTRTTVARRLSLWRRLLVWVANRDLRRIRARTLNALSPAEAERRNLARTLADQSFNDSTGRAQNASR